MVRKIYNFADYIFKRKLKIWLNAKPKSKCFKTPYYSYTNYFRQAKRYEMNASWIDLIRLKKRKNRFLKLENTFDESIRFIELSNALIRYKVAGTGEKTIVFIPDPPNTIEHYDQLISSLEKDFKVVVFELPVSGFSIPTTNKFKFRLQDFLKTSEEFLEFLGFNNYVLSFSCVSGFIALRLAAKRPDIIHNLIFIQTPNWQEEKKWAKKIDYKGLLHTRYVGQLFMMFRHKWVAKNWYHIALPKETDKSVYWEPCNECMDKGSHFSLASLFQGLFHNQPPDFEIIKQRSIIIWGDKDRSHRKTNKQSSEKYFSNFSTHIFDNCGHFPELENSIKFAAIVRLELKTRI